MKIQHLREKRMYRIHPSIHPSNECIPHVFICGSRYFPRSWVLYGVSDGTKSHMESMGRDFQCIRKQ